MTGDFLLGPSSVTDINVYRRPCLQAYSSSIRDVESLMSKMSRKRLRIFELFFVLRYPGENCSGGRSEEGRDRGHSFWRLCVPHRACPGQSPRCTRHESCRWTIPVSAWNSPDYLNFWSSFVIIITLFAFHRKLVFSLLLVLILFTD